MTVEIPTFPGVAGATVLAVLGGSPCLGVGSSVWPDTALAGSGSLPHAGSCCCGGGIVTFSRASSLAMKGVMATWTMAWSAVMSSWPHVAPKFGQAFLGVGVGEGLVW